MSIQTPEQVLQQARIALEHARDFIGDDDVLGPPAAYHDCVNALASIDAALAGLPAAAVQQADDLPPGWPEGAFFTDGEGRYYDEDAEPLVSGLPAAAVPTQQPSRSKAFGMYEKHGAWTPGQLAALGRLPDGLYELRSPPLTTEQLRAAFACPAPAAAPEQQQDDAQHAAWLADKIVALGDYAKEAAAMLRRWPVHLAVNDAAQDIRDGSALSASATRAEPLPCCGYVPKETGQPNPHPVMWNPWNKVVQCHNCGEVWQSRASVPSAEHAQLMKFYGVDSLAALVDKQAHHVERLQAKLPPTPNIFAPHRVREG